MTNSTEQLIAEKLLEELFKLSKPDLTVRDTILVANTSLVLAKSLAELVIKKGQQSPGSLTVSLSLE